MQKNSGLDWGDLIMVKRFLSATPRELLSYTGRELLASIRSSEGRVIIVSARCRSANLIDNVSNAEVAAAFGADLILLDTYDVSSPSVPGWPSKEPSVDAPYADVQVPRGLGYTLKEVRERIGRPVGVLLGVAEPERAQALIACYGNIVATPETAKAALEAGANFLSIAGWGSRELCLSTIQAIRAAVGPDPIIEFNRPHGPGLMNYSDGASDLMEQEEAVSLVRAGADIVGIPAPGTFPGWTVEKCGAIAETLHQAGALCSLGVHTSQEGSNPQVLEHIALYSKMAGADIHELGDSGFNEQHIPPENILAFGVAIRGRRHHYRRMAMSSFR